MRRCSSSWHGDNDCVRLSAISTAPSSNFSATARCACWHRKEKNAPVDTPKNKATQPEASITGTWNGELNQVGSTAPYKFELSITAKGAETKYADLDCIGQLTRVGQSKSYVFFVEVITKGQADKGGRCPDGTITIARQGGNLALSWFDSVQGNIIVATGLLSKR